MSCARLESEWVDRVSSDFVVSSNVLSQIFVSKEFGEYYGFVKLGFDLAADAFDAETKAVASLYVAFGDAKVDAGLGAKSLGDIYKTLIAGVKTVEEISSVHRASIALCKLGYNRMDGEFEALDKTSKDVFKARAEDMWMMLRALEFSCKAELFMPRHIAQSNSGIQYQLKGCWLRESRRFAVWSLTLGFSHFWKPWKK